MTPKAIPPAWLPAWRDPAAYAFTQGLSLDQWAWQFIRRSPDYQRAWRAASKKMRRNYEQSCKTFDFEPRPEDPGFLSPVDEEAWRRTWGLKLPYDPADDTPDLFIPLGRSDGPVSAADVWDLEYVQETLEEATPTESWQYQVVGVLDLRVALGPQVDHIKSSAQFRQHRLGLKSSRSHTPNDMSRWVFYLQLLDARAAGASRQEMADHFYPDYDPDTDSDPVEQIGERLKQARRYFKPEAYLKFLGLPTD